MNRPDWPSLILVLVTAIALLGGVATFRLAASPLPSAIVSPVGSERSSQPATDPTVPPVFLDMAAAVATAFAPTPEPTATPVRKTPTPLPVLFCGPDVAEGRACTQPFPTPLPPTAIPPCPVDPGSLCIQGGRKELP